MITAIPLRVTAILADYNPTTPRATAAALHSLWLEFAPKSVGGIKAEQREQQETVGIPVPVLAAIGKAIGQVARRRVDDFIPLARLLWDAYGREGRVVALIPLGIMELSAPETILPLLLALCRTCVTWEDADRLAMDAVEPVVRKQPEEWVGLMAVWVADENKWVRRAGITVIGRLAMQRADYVTLALETSERLLFDAEVDVKRAVSFAIRLAARSDVTLVRAFLARHVPPTNPAATWVLCDVIRSMATKLLPEFAPLLAHYEQWSADATLSTQDRRSVMSAIEKLRGIAEPE